MPAHELHVLGVSAGMLHFATDLTSDVCVYPERLVFTIVNGTHVANSETSTI